LLETFALTARATLETRVLRGFKAGEEIGALAEATPQQAEFLTSGVQPISQYQCWLHLICHHIDG